MATHEPGEQAETDPDKPLDLSSTQQRQQLLRGKLWDDMINSLETGSRNRRVGKKLKQLVNL